MGNSKETICGELLYELMLYEKINFKTGGRWKVKEQKSLLEDLEIMKQLIQLIELKRDIMFGEIKNIILYLERKGIYMGNIFQRKDLKVIKFYGKANIEINLQILSLIESAEKIILENQKRSGLKEVILKKKRKDQIWLILMGMHNLPRVYLDGKGEFDELEKMLILPEDALQYSSSYLEALEKAGVLEARGGRFWQRGSI